MERLVGKGPEVARLVGVWPHSVQRGTVSRTTKVAHRPDGWPETVDIRTTREYDACDDETTGEAELVPGGDHAAHIV